MQAPSSLNYVSSLWGMASPISANAVCNHEAVVVRFDAVRARRMSAFEVRNEYPRFSGLCPVCMANITKYASFEHYTSGDW